MIILSRLITPTQMALKGLRNSDPCGCVARSKLQRLKVSKLTYLPSRGSVDYILRFQIRS